MGPPPYAHCHPENPANPCVQGYELFGFTRDGNAIVFREWAPAAQSAQLIGDFNGWHGTPLERDGFGVWSARLPDGANPTINPDPDPEHNPNPNPSPKPNPEPNPTALALTLLDSHPDPDPTLNPNPNTKSEPHPLPRPWSAHLPVGARFAPGRCGMVAETSKWRLHYDGSALSSDDYQQGCSAWRRHQSPYVAARGALDGLDPVKPRMCYLLKRQNGLRSRSSPIGTSFLVRLCAAELQRCILTRTRCQQLHAASVRS